MRLWGTLFLLFFWELPNGNQIPTLTQREKLYRLVLDIRHWLKLELIERGCAFKGIVVACYSMKSLGLVLKPCNH
jgi:hypothetical protein